MTASRVVSLGCRLNAAEAATIETLLARAGDGETLVVNTCAVTGEAERDGLAAIRRLRRANPAARIVATGCAVQLDPSRYEALPEIDAVVGNAAKLDPASWAARESTAPGFDGRPAFVEDAPGFAEDRPRAFVEIQQGCDHRCTFCIIPFARGPSRSLPPERAVARIRQAAAAGRREVVLTGVDLTAWGDDLPGRPRLGDLCAAILAGVPDLARLRLSSLSAMQTIISRIAADKLGHLSLTREGLAARNARVFTAVEGLGVPVVVLMGGGYGRPPEATAEAFADLFLQAADHHARCARVEA
jgi:threonylcarbamoyladenosine tRNA methylthiotransferase MtaB